MGLAVFETNLHEIGFERGERALEPAAELGHGLARGGDRCRAAAPAGGRGGCAVGGRRGRGGGWRGGRTVSSGGKAPRSRGCASINTVSSPAWVEAPPMRVRPPTAERRTARLAGSAGGSGTSNLRLTVAVMCDATSWR